MSRDMFLMLWFVSVAGVLLGSLVAFLKGYERGVRETERRWSNAVKRKEHDDAWRTR